MFSCAAKKVGQFFHIHYLRLTNFIPGDARFEKNVTVVQTFNGELVSALTRTFWFTDVPTTISAVAFISSLVAGGSFSVDVRVRILPWSFLLQLGLVIF